MGDAMGCAFPLPRLLVKAAVMPVKLVVVE
jgi:hypothetical protein